MITLIGDLGYDIRMLENRTARFLGGSGFHTAVGVLAASSIPHLVATVGRDFDDEYLKKLSIPTTHIERKQNSMTPCYIIDYRSNVRRISFRNWPSPSIAIKEHMPELLFSDIVHITATLPQQQLRYIEYLKQNHYSGKISVDVFDQHCAAYPIETLSVLSQSDIIFMNQDEKRLLQYSHYNPQKITVIKRADQGADCFCQSNSYHAEFHVDHVIDTIGAGDILAGAFLAFFDEQFELNECLSKAVEIASCSVQFFGSELFGLDCIKKHSIII